MVTTTTTPPEPRSGFWNTFSTGPSTTSVFPLYLSSFVIGSARKSFATTSAFTSSAGPGEPFLSGPGPGRSAFAGAGFSLAGSAGSVLRVSHPTSRRRPARVHAPALVRSEVAWHLPMRCHALMMSFTVIPLGIIGSTCSWCGTWTFSTNGPSLLDHLDRGPRRGRPCRSTPRASPRTPRRSCTKSGYGGLVLAGPEVRVAAVRSEEPVLPLHHHARGAGCSAAAPSPRSSRRSAVASSWMFIRKLPSPSMSMTSLSGCATFAPIAAGRPKPIVPRPPLVTQCRGRLKRKYCAAHIWCWPTPVVTIVSSSCLRSRRISQSRLIAYCGRIACSGLGELQRLGLAPGVDLPQPVGVPPAADRGPRSPPPAACALRSSSARPQVAVDRDVGELVLVDLRLVDVDVDDLAVLGELGQLAGHAVVEPHAERQQQVGVVDRVVRVHGAVHAEHVQAQVVVGGEAAQPVQGQPDRDAGPLGELLAGRPLAPLWITPPPA